jgi:hypothetical protein
MLSDSLFVFGDIEANHPIDRDCGLDPFDLRRQLLLHAQALLHDLFQFHGR